MEQTTPAEVIDTLEPDQEGLQRHEEHISNFFETAFAGQNRGNKRKAPNNSQNATFRKMKIESSSVEDIRNIAADPTALKKKTIAVLKDYCDVLGLNKAGRKDELVLKIVNNFN